MYVAWDKEYWGCDKKDGIYANWPNFFKLLVTLRAYLAWALLLPDTKVFGYVACQTASRWLGVGSVEQSWSDVKQIKDGKRSNLNLFTSEKLNETQIEWSHEMKVSTDDFFGYDNLLKVLCLIFLIFFV